MRRDVVLARVVVEALVAVAEEEAQYIGLGAFALEPNVQARLGECASESEQDRLEGGVASQQRAHGDEVLHAPAPALGVDEADLRAVLGDDLHRAGDDVQAVQRGRGALLDHRHLAVGRGDDEQVREEAQSRRGESQAVLDRQLHLDALRDVDEAAAAPEGAVQAEVLPFARRDSGEEVLAHQLRVLAGGGMEVGHDDALPRQRFVERPVRHGGIDLNQTSG